MQGLPPVGWHRSTYSDDFDNACVEVARNCGRVLVRDSKDVDRVPLAVGAAAWSGFVDVVCRTAV
jgi:hypothetical protein